MTKLIKIIGIGTLVLTSLVGCSKKENVLPVEQYLNSLYQEKYDLVLYRDICKKEGIMDSREDSSTAAIIEGIDSLCEQIEGKMADDFRENFYKKLKQHYGDNYSRIERKEKK